MPLNRHTRRKFKDDTFTEQLRRMFYRKRMATENKVPQGIRTAGVSDIRCNFAGSAGTMCSCPERGYGRLVCFQRTDYHRRLTELRHGEHRHLELKPAYPGSRKGVQRLKLQ